jgi:anthranilate synthase/aminodeoxychorismate synthase-like glutamine amidotransferase
MLLLIDNFDSFTYNIAQAFQKLGVEVCVKRNNIQDYSLSSMTRPDYLVIGPGPGSPKDSGISQTLIQQFSGKVPILGICLGMQCMAALFGGAVIRSPLGPMHGKTSPIHHKGKGVFTELPQEFLATRYHSLVVERATLPDCFEITAETEQGEIMGIAHKNLAMEGVQFHPESVLTLEGERLLKNYLLSR